LKDVAKVTDKADKAAERSAKKSVKRAGLRNDAGEDLAIQKSQLKREEKAEEKKQAKAQVLKERKAAKAKKRVAALEAELEEARRTIAAADTDADLHKEEEEEAVAVKEEELTKEKAKATVEKAAEEEKAEDAKAEEEAPRGETPATPEELERNVIFSEAFAASSSASGSGGGGAAHAAMGATALEQPRASPSEKYGGARVSSNNNAVNAGATTTTSAAVSTNVPLPTPSFRNRFGVIPGLLEHVQAREAPALNAATIRDDDRLRYVTYANAAYWPVAKVLIASIAHNAPHILPRLTVMLTHRPDVEECHALSSSLKSKLSSKSLPSQGGIDCFYDADMVEILGEYAHEEGSLEKAGVSVPVEKHADAEKLGMALRIVWCWRKVHAVYTLVKAGYPAVFLDASTVILNDPREAIVKHFNVASLVTLSDFGGKKEQKSINTVGRLYSC
jgi:hypothetical protein